DDHQHLRIPNADAWFEAYAPLAAGGLLTLYDNNEPGTLDLPRQNEWMARGLERMEQAGIRVVGGGNMQTHNRFDPALIHDTLRVIKRYGHRFGIHYYYSPTYPIDPVGETVLAYCRRVGIGDIPLYVTELGYAHNLDP